MTAIASLRRNAARRQARVADADMAAQAAFEGGKMCNAAAGGSHARATVESRTPAQS
jgi:hypothetical protein